MTTKLQNASGFTLIELLIATVISLALGIGGFAFYRSQARSLTDQSAGLDAIEGARAALDFMSADIRMAGANRAGTWTPAANSCAAGLSTAQASSLTIAWDGANGTTIDIDGTIAAGETIRYWYDAGTKTIVRTVNSVDTTLIKNVPAGGLSFSYFDSSGSVALTGSPAQVPASKCDGVTRVKITVQVETARATTVTKVSLSSYVALRNRQGVLNKL